MIVAHGENIGVRFLEIADADADEWHGTAATEGDGLLPLRERAVLPFTVLGTGGVDLHVTLGIGFMVGKNGFILCIKGYAVATIDDASTGQDWIYYECSLIKTYGQLDFFAKGGFPFYEVFAAGIREVLVGGAIRRVTPHPVNVKQSIGAASRARGIGVAFSFAIEEWLFEQARPRIGFAIIAVVEVDAISRAAVPVGEDESPFVIFEKSWIGDAVFE